MKTIIVVFLLLTNISYSQELGMLLNTVSETKDELKRISLEYKYINDSTIETNLSNSKKFIFKFINNYCYHEEFQTTNLHYNLDSIRLLLSHECFIFDEDIYYYKVGNYRFYYIIVKNDNYIQIIKTIRKMFLTEEEEIQESKEIVSDLFGNIGKDQIRSTIEAMSKEDKEKAIVKIGNYTVFYNAISKEEPRGNNFRVLTAKFRCETLYPQLLELLKS